MRVFLRSRDKYVYAEGEYDLETKQLLLLKGEKL